MSRVLGRTLVLASAFAIGAATGWLVSQDTVSIVVGGSLGIAAAFLTVVLDIKAVVAVPIVVGTAAGALIGRAVVRILCLPGGCPEMEATAAVLTGIGAFTGIAVVVSLAMRSLDEYRETARHDRRAPTAGRESDDGSGS